jgi:murein hydrolase activator
MIHRKQILKYFFLLIFYMSSIVVFSQSNKQAELEARRQELKQEIRRISQLQAENKSKEKSQLSLIQEFNHKINMINDLVKLTNQQTNLLTRDINTNQKKISSLGKELNGLKKEYAAMVVKSYKSKNQQSRIMFLLSSENFKQAYKRLQYIKQYSKHQKQQGETIKEKTIELQESNKDLLTQKANKQKLIAENRGFQKSLEKERLDHQNLMNSIKKNINLYASQIREKQREADRIDREIENIIKAAIASSNKKAGKTTTTTTKSATSFALTAEEKVLAASFVSNKGKLPWPVERGRVTVGFGTQPHPLDKSLTIKSNGVRISTEKGAIARAVFNGEVSGIVLIKNANPIVMIRHGNYITAYKNLSKVYVKEGDKVITKQSIGEVFTNPSDGETILNFIIFKDTQAENPASWIFKM